MKSTYPTWFYIPAGVLLRRPLPRPDLRVVLLLAHPLDAVRRRVHRLRQLRAVLPGAAARPGLHQHLHLRVPDLGREGRARPAARRASDRRRSSAAATCARRSSSRCSSRRSASASPFKVLMDPFDGLDQRDARRRSASQGPAGSPTRRSRCYSVALVDIWKGVGLATLIYIAGIVAIPQEYFEAAKVDGAGAWKNFRHITLPLVRPATATVICSRSSAACARSTSSGR